RRRFLSIITVLPFFRNYPILGFLTVLMSDLKTRCLCRHARRCFRPEDSPRLPETDLVAVAEQGLGMGLEALDPVEVGAVDALQVFDDEAAPPAQDEGMAPGYQAVRVDLGQVDVGFDPV